MLSFFLKKVLGRSLLLPVIWSSAHLSFTGDLIINGLRLEANDMRLKLAHSRLDPQWRTIFDDRIQVEEARLRGGVFALSLENPLSLIHCLESSRCTPKGQLESEIKGLFPPAASNERARLGDAASVEKSRSSKLKPLEFDVAKMSVKDSIVLLVRGSSGIALDVVSLKADALSIPLGTKSISLKADVYVREILPNELRGEVWEPDYSAPVSDEVARYPLRMQIDWNPESRILKAELLFREIPLKLLSAAFPKQFSSEGTLGGQLLLEYDAEARIWRTPEGGFPKLSELLR